MCRRNELAALLIDGDGSNQSPPPRPKLSPRERKRHFVGGGLPDPLLLLVPAVVPLLA